MPEFVSAQEAQENLDRPDSVGGGETYSEYTDYPHLQHLQNDNPPVEEEQQQEKEKETTQPSERELELQKRVEELEKRYSAPEPDQEQEPKQEVLTFDGEATEYYGKVIGELFEENGFDWRGMNYYYQANGFLKEEHYNSLEKLGLDPEIVDDRLYGITRRANEQSQQQDAPQQYNHTKQEEDKIIDEIGGDDELKKLQAYTNANWDRDRLDEFTAAIKDGNYAAVRFAVKSAYNEYKTSLGKEGRSFTKGTNSASDGGYKNPIEKKAALDDPRYGNDFNYTTMVNNKLAATYRQRY